MCWIFIHQFYKVIKVPVPLAVGCVHIISYPTLTEGGERILAGVRAPGGTTVRQTDTRHNPLSWSIIHPLFPPQPPFSAKSRKTLRARLRPYLIDCHRHYHYSGCGGGARGKDVCFFAPREFLKTYVFCQTSVWSFVNFGLKYYGFIVSSKLVLK